MLNGFFTVPSHQHAKDNLDRMRNCSGYPSLYRA
jgi:hypothetical protein